MRIITLNTNGIRAAERKGFFHWLHTQQADIVCIQETKAQYGNLSVISVYLPSGSSSDERQQIKFSFLDHSMPFLQQFAQNGRETTSSAAAGTSHINRST